MTTEEVQAIARDPHVRSLVFSVQLGERYSHFVASHRFGDSGLLRPVWSERCSAPPSGSDEVVPEMALHHFLRRTTSGHILWMSSSGSGSV